MAKEISAFLRAESGDDATDPTQEPQNRTFGRLAKMRLEFAEDVAATAKASAWARAVEKLHRRQAALKEREAAAHPKRSRAIPSQQASRHTSSEPRA